MVSLSKATDHVGAVLKQRPFFFLAALAAGSAVRRRQRMGIVRSVAQASGTHIGHATYLRRGAQDEDTEDRHLLTLRVWQCLKVRKAYLYHPSECTSRVDSAEQARVYAIPGNLC